MGDFDDDTVVLVAGVVTKGGRYVRLAPGIEVAIQSLEVVADVPPMCDPVLMTMMFFATVADRDEFCAHFMGEPNVGLRDIEKLPGGGA